MDSLQWDERYAASELVWSAGPNQWVEAELTGLPPGRAIDLAAGEARNSNWLAGLGWTVLAVDFSPVALAKGQQLVAAAEDGRAARVSWLTADLTEFVPEPDSYQLALICYLQVSAADRTLIVRRALSALAPGGALLVVGHDSTNLTDGVGGPQDPAVLYSAPDLVADLTASAIPVRVDKATTVLRQVAGSPRPAIDTLFRAVRLS